MRIGHETPRQDKRRSPATRFPATRQGSAASQAKALAGPPWSKLNPLTHRNTSFQPLPRPLQLIAQAIPKAGPMTFHVVGDTGGVKDAEFQNNVAAQ
jgi:hypothetical protein